MSINELYGELDYWTMELRAAERAYHTYVKMRGWSADICAEVDAIQRFMAHAEKQLALIRDDLGLTSESSSSA